MTEKNEKGVLPKAMAPILDRLVAAGRFLDPKNLLFRLRVRARGAANIGTIYLVPHNRHIVRLVADAALELECQGVPCVFVHLDGLKRGGVAKPELQARNLPHIDFSTLRKRIRPGDVLVTGNDHAPKFFRHFVDSINGGMVPVVGLLGGARELQKHRFVRADYILSMTPAVFKQRRQPVYVVGSVVVERSIGNIAGGRREGRFVLINFKGDFEKAEERTALEKTVKACVDLGIPYRISVHPTTAAKFDIPNRDTADFAELLPDALTLVTRPSTIVYEAIAAGVPVVVYPPAYPLVEFEEPLGAFRVLRTDGDLGEAIRMAVASRPDYHQIGKAFLEENLSIDPQVPAARRMTEALADIYSKTRTSGVRTKPGSDI